MAKTLTRRHERVDDIPLIIGLAHELRVAEILPRHLRTHGLQEGLNHGQLAVGGLAYLLSQADHRQAAVREWANDLPHTLGRLLGQPIREVEFSDDRVGGVRRRLSDDEVWQASAPNLGAATVAVYALARTGIRLDSPTSSGSHAVTEAGVRPCGPSKEHRPDLPPLQLRAAAAEPAGHVIAGDLAPGQWADDPLYTPLIQRVRGLVGRTGWLSAGDGKLAALTTRAERVAPGDF